MNLHSMPRHSRRSARPRLANQPVQAPQAHNGWDAFLLDEPELFAIVRGFLDGAAHARGLAVKS